MRTLSIIHVEDEFREYFSLVTFVQTVVDDIVESKFSGTEILTKVTKVADSGAPPLRWIVFQIACVSEEVPEIRYIFVRDVDIPEKVVPYLLDRRVLSWIF
jgi:hypothetical protein